MNHPFKRLEAQVSGFTQLMTRWAPVTSHLVVLTGGEHDRLQGAPCHGHQPHWRSRPWCVLQFQFQIKKGHFQFLWIEQRKWHVARLRTFEATGLNQSLLDPFYCWILVLCLEMVYLHTEWPKKLQNNIQLKCYPWEPFYFSIEAHSENFDLMSPRYPKKARSDYHISLCHKGNGSYVIKDFGTLPLIFSTQLFGCL